MNPYGAMRPFDLSAPSGLQPYYCICTLLTHNMPKNQRSWVSLMIDMTLLNLNWWLDWILALQGRK